MVAVLQNPGDDKLRAGVGSTSREAIVYPESDGLPMSDNTKQWDWIVLLETNIDAVVPDFVAGDLLWYPVEGRPEIRVAPDVLVALGRPKGYRGSYLQWREEGVIPAVAIEVLSPGNSTREMMRKSGFYHRYGVKEQIVIDPDREDGWAFTLDPNGELMEVPTLDGWVSPVLGIRFAIEEGVLRVYRPDGTRFLSPAELEQRANSEAERANSEAERANSEAERANSEAERANRLADKLRELGLDPDAL